jgi:hypothetical protein
MDTSISNEELESIAEEAYVYAFPAFMGYRGGYDKFLNPSSPAYRGAPNAGPHGKAVTLDSSFKGIITPNSDTPYSWGLLDLRAGPLVLTVPEVTDRYYVMQFENLLGENEYFVGSRATGSGAGTYLLVGPRWDGDLPDGFADTLRFETDLVYLIGRTQLFSPEDKDALAKIMVQYKLETLEEFNGDEAPAVPDTDWPVWDDAVLKDERFVGLLNRLLEFTGPIDPDEADMHERFAKIGIGAGVDFDVDALSDDQRAALARGTASADAKIKKAAGEQGEIVNGWMMMDPFGNRAFFNGDFLKRAAVAMIGWGGNDKAEAFYPMLRKGPDGKPLDGNGKYQLTFELPIPVNAFWSLTMYDTAYDGVGGYMVDNPIDRYLINSLTPGLVEENGSLTITMQRDEPEDPTERANWLPTPDMDFYLAFRLYWPKEEALDGTWAPPEIVRLK